MKLIISFIVSMMMISPILAQSVVDVECASGAQTMNFCYGNNDNSTFTFTSDTGFPVQLEFIDARIEANWDEVTIYDGSDNTGDVLFNGDNGGNLAGLVFISTGDSLFMEMDSDGSVSCQSSAAFNPWEFEYSCLTCINPEVNYEVISDCGEGNQFFVEVNLTSIGDAMSININDNQGSEEHNTTTTGTFIFGPYSNGTLVSFTVDDNDDANCSLISTDLTQEFCPDQACAIINAGFDTTVNCNAGGSVDLNATFMTSANTTDTSTYMITDLSCPVTNLTGESADLQIDDRWSEVIDLGFNFEYFGTTYSQVVIGANGLIGFDIDLAGNFCPWNFDDDELIPTADLPTNAIHGAYHDINPARGGTIEYSSLGTAPQRQFKVSFVHIPHFGCNELLTTSQIILYESSNVIDVIVSEKPTCTTWNDGLAVIGIQNEDGSVGYSPTGRNTGDWSVSFQELWRFVPDGDPNYVFEWFDEDGVSLGNDPAVSVSPTETTTYTANVTYTANDGTTSTVSDDVVVTYIDERPTFGAIDNIANCSEDPSENPIYNLTTQDAIIIGSETDMTVTYHVSEEDAMNNLNAILDADAYQSISIPQTIYFRLENNLATACYAVGNFDLLEDTPPEIVALENLENCADSTGTAVFDLTVQDIFITGVETDVTITYYESLADAEDETNPILNSSSYQSLSTTQTMYYRLARNTNPSCIAIGQFDLVATFIDLNLIAFENGCIDNVYNIKVLPVDNSYNASTSSYQWFGPIGTDYTGINSDTIIATEDGTYTVEITTDMGCFYSKSLEINNSSCIFPQGISPNGDRKNDTFDLSVFDVQSIEIFNRQGRSVYKKSNYIDEWIGQSDNGDLPVGTYYYVAKLANEETRKGWVYIQR